MHRISAVFLSSLEGSPTLFLEEKAGKGLIQRRYRYKEKTTILPLYGIKTKRPSIIATICAKTATIGDTYCTGEAEWFNRKAATDEGAARKNKKSHPLGRWMTFLEKIHPYFI